MKKRTLADEVITGLGQTAFNQDARLAIACAMLATEDRLKNDPEWTQRFALAYGEQVVRIFSEFNNGDAK